MISKIKKWIRKNKGEFYLLLLILAVGAILRLYKIGGYMTFLGDEGRDAIIVRRLLVNFDPVLIGPGTSIGNMYLGPLYYYLSAPFLLFANFSPVGPSVMVALFGVATIYLIWYIARLWFGKGAGMVSSLLYALAPVVIIYNRSSWNPNIMPFFALLTIFSLWKVWGEEKFSWFVVMGVSFAFVLQSHYLGLLLLPVILFFWSLKHWGLFRNSDLEISNYPGNYLKKSYIKNLLIGTIVFAVLMSPLLIFDLRHNFMNFNNIKTFFTQRETTVSVKPWKSLPNIYPIFRDSVVHRLVAAQNILAGKISINIIVFAVVTYMVLMLTKLKRILFTSDEKLYFDKGALLLIVWIGSGLIGLGLYKQHVYDHYFGFIYPAIFLLIGAIYQKIMNSHFDGLKIIITAWIVVLIGSYVVYSPVRGQPNFQMARAADVAKVIREDAGSSKFNLAVVAVQNYEDGYQYFLEKDGANVTDIDALRLEETMGEYLYVVCELPEENCDPVNSPKAEVANFGWSKVVGKWGRGGVTIFKLAHVTP
ncbi:MAG: hypothetical protein UT06_C0037G0019 [Candidatus Woesebacteria bacterium GW2011_GWA1_38_8]|uniref:Glycosyltransferase RgtA/B/C/D-like domain-containing protein n=1 Tax=Candidatus Woesebacteria bacterium GW2011_GWA1_38_8 TaxID=1618547 RepID=A0A0G0KSX3_9BACT|nr:MAG: hypothetical protein UT06_C0037G0019 [Candidatus Woesebacteria bacterium GW2011_GWA1_38_8]